MIDNPYQTLPIVDCQEPLLSIAPETGLSFAMPHPYVTLGAPYAGASPWRLRRGVLAALSEAQAALQQRHPDLRLQLFDAWRPLAVQAYMVWREFGRQARACGLSLAQYQGAADLQQRAPQLHAQLAPRVFEFWSPPSSDPQTPPPHSTGAALDLTLADADGQALDMGSAIDETSMRAYPRHYAADETSSGRCYHQRRQLLDEVMRLAGFAQHPNEWWHYSLGDQLWAWQRGVPVARYGRTPDA